MTRWGIVVVVGLAGCPGSGPSPRTPEDPSPPREDAWVAPTAPALPAVEAGALTWDDDDLAQLDASGPLLVDGDRLVWASYDGAIRAAPLAGGPATVLARFDEVVALAAGGDRLYALSSDALFELPRDGAPVGLASLSLPEALAIGPGGIYVADGDWILEVPLAGGAPRTLATEVGHPSAIAVAGDHVYWTDGGFEPDPEIGYGCGAPIARMNGEHAPAPTPELPCENELRYGAIARVAIAGGQVQERSLYHPRALAVFDDHVYWADAGGEAAMRADLDGNHREVVIGGRGVALAVDATSTVVVGPTGFLVEAPADGAPPWPKAGDVHGVAIALTADTIFVSARGVGVFRFPRGPTGATLLAVPSGRAEDIAVSGDHVYYLDVHADDRDDVVMRVARAGGAPEQVATHAGAAGMLAVDGEHVAVYDNDAMTLAVDGAVLATDVAPDALAIDAHAVYWLQDVAVRAQPLAGGPVEILLPPDPLEVSYGAGGGKPPARLDVHDGVIVAADEALGAVVTIDTRKAKPKVKARGKATITRVGEGAFNGGAAGEHVVAWTPDGLTLYPGAKLLMASDWRPDALVADARDAYVVLEGNLLRVPLDGAPTTVLLTGLYGARLALDATAVYAVGGFGDAIVKVAR